MTPKTIKPRPFPAPAVDKAKLLRGAMTWSRHVWAITTVEGLVMVRWAIRFVQHDGQLNQVVLHADIDSPRQRLADELREARRMAKAAQRGTIQ